MSSPGFEEKGYEESIMSSALCSVRTSSRGDPTSPHDIDVLNDVVMIVNKFLLKNVGDRMSQKEMNKRGYTISRYLVNVASTFVPDQTDEILPCVVDNFRNFLSKDIQSLLTTKDIVLLFTDIVMLTQGMENDVDPKDVMNSIIEQAIETFPVDSGHQTLNYTQDILTEIVKQMLGTLPIVEVTNPVRLEQLKDKLKDVENINPRCIDKIQLIAEVTGYASSNLIDDVNLNVMKTIVDLIYDILTKE